MCCLITHDNNYVYNNIILVVVYRKICVIITYDLLYLLPELNLVLRRVSVQV